jgi:prepilin signal peptidase PulO-like enzyme (type II secretory pathway)
MSNVHVLYYRIEEEPLIPVGVNCKCARCEDGYLEYTGNMICRDGADLFRHECTHCDNRVDFDKVYPSIKYDDLKNHVKSCGCM